MNNKLDDNINSRISLKKYSTRLLILFAILLIIIGGSTLYFSNTTMDGFKSTFIFMYIIPLFIFSIYLIYYSSKRIAHAVINKLIILPFIFLFVQMMLNINNIDSFYLVEYFFLYVVILSLISLLLPKIINERKYIFNNKTYKTIADFFDISKQIENILFFKYANSISRRDFFTATLFITLINIFIIAIIVYAMYMAEKLEYNDFCFYFFMIFEQILLFSLITYVYAILFINRVGNVLGSSVYNLLLFTIVFILTNIYSFLYVIFSSLSIIDISFLLVMFICFIIYLIVGLLPPKKEKVHE